jgi:hypothetical protein
MPKKLLKMHLLEILEGSAVHCGIEQAIGNIPFEYWGKKTKKMPHTLFELFEHIRYANKDILEYITDPHYKAGNWPEDYWPENKKPKSPEELKEKIQALHLDMKAIKKMLMRKPLLDPLPYGKKSHTLTREVMILSNHLAYHLGQFVLVRRLLDIWD